MISIALLAIALSVAGRPMVDPTANSGEVNLPIDGNIGKWILVRQAKPGDHVAMDLIRGEVLIERSSTDRVELKVEGPRNPDLTQIVLMISWLGDRTSVIDTFPQRSWLWRDDCLPPPDARGDFWRATVKPRIRLRVPAGVIVDVRIREGKVVGV